MIALPNKDGVFFDIQYRVCDIIKEYQDTGFVRINTNHEGLCIRSSELYDLLDYVCLVWGIEKKKIIITTNNVEEFHDEYTIEILGNHWIYNSKDAFLINLPPKNIQKTIGCFIGKPNWHRLVTAAWLYTNYKDKTQMTVHYDPTSERHRIDSELTEINRQAPSELPSVIEFIPSCPITMDEGFLNYTIGPPTHYNILANYKDIFADLVIETYVKGLTFFPTEKTLRPIIAKTPFVIMGPCGYLANLKRIGFKTFDTWWDESYDFESDYSRILRIREVLTEIYKWDNEKLKTVLMEMTPILEHNYALLKTLDSDSVKLMGT